MICYLKSKTHVNRIMSEETQQRRLFLFRSKLFQASSPNNQREREFHMSVSATPENLNPIFEDHVGSDMTKEEFRQLCKAAWERQHGFVIIDLSSRKHNGRYRRGLGEVYIPN